MLLCQSVKSYLNFVTATYTHLHAGKSPTKYILNIQKTITIQ